VKGTFRSLQLFNFRVWIIGALISNIGGWMQSTAQDWVVLTELTHNDATAMGVTMALQFGPPLVLVGITGWVADRFDRRRLLMVTQTALMALGLTVGILLLTHVMTLPLMWCFALGFGVANAFDGPARQTFVSDVVSRENASNAVALNAASFNTARLIGPAGRRDLQVVFLMVFLVGAFGMNFPIFASTMALEFGQQANGYGVLSSVLAIGSLAGALLAAQRERARMRVVMFAAGGFGVASLVSSFMPLYGLYAVTLVFVGFCTVTMLTTANGYVQTTTDAALRGRVLALYMAILMGSTPIGAPIAGWVATTFGPRAAIQLGATAGLVACAIGAAWLLSSGRVHRHEDGGLRLTIDETRPLRVVSPTMGGKAD